MFRAKLPINLIFAVLFLNGFSSYSQTYYYESASTSANGHYVTIGINCCYDSDSEGFIIGNKLIYKGLQNGEHKYSGSSYWGITSALYFSSDYKKLRVRNLENGKDYFFNQKSNTGKVSSHQQSSKKGSEGSSVLITSPIVSPVLPNTFNLSEGGTVNTTQICSGCGGSGICTSCRGTGGSWQSTGYYTGSGSKTWIQCGVCHGSGRCGVCHGTGKL